MLTPQLPDATRLLALVLPMFDGRDEEGIRTLAGESISTVGACRLGAGRAWHRTFPGAFVVSAPEEPSAQEMHLLTLLAEQTRLALANATARRRDGEQIQRLRREHADLAHLHRVLYASLGDGEPGVAEALHRLTGLPAAVEDLFGNPRAWAGPGRPDPYPKPSPARRRELLHEVTRRGPVARVKDRLIAVSGEPLESVLVLVDPDRTAGPHELLALEHGAMVLTGELAHRHDMISLVGRLGRDLVDDLLTGNGDDSAYDRARAVGHDLRGPHHVVAIQWAGGDVPAAAAGLGVGTLTSVRDGVTVLLARDRPDGWALYHALAKRLRGKAGALGVGGRCDALAEFPRSYREALLALEVRVNAHSPHGATSFEELGVLRVLDGTKIRRFVRDWLGALLDYDAGHGSDLVGTLSRHLECGGNYDDTAAALLIHRSTLRYRLQRIREISGLDITDVDTRLNLHVATQAWQTMG